MNKSRPSYEGRLSIFLIHYRLYGLHLQSGSLGQEIAKRLHRTAAQRALVVDRIKYKLYINHPFNSKRLTSVPVFCVACSAGYRSK